jgi:hypothetical protein
MRSPGPRRGFLPGLRSGDKYAPYPEEMNRIMAGHLADIHFTPTEQSNRNLAAEGITQQVFNVGNTVIDALFLGLDLLRPKGEAFFRAAFNGVNLDRKLVLITGHRRESFGAPFEQIVRDSEKPDTTHYTNGFIARYAQDIADRLGVIQPDDSEEEEEEEEEEEVVVEEFEADIEVELEPLGPELLVTVGRVIDRMRESKSDTPAATEPEAVVESPAEPTSLSERCLKPLYDIMTAGSKFPGPFFHPRNAKGS